MTHSHSQLPKTSSKAQPKRKSMQSNEQAESKQQDENSNHGNTERKKTKRSESPSDEAQEQPSTALILRSILKSVSTVEKTSLQVRFSKYKFVRTIPNRVEMNMTERLERQHELNEMLKDIETTETLHIYLSELPNANRRLLKQLPTITFAATEDDLLLPQIKLLATQYNITLKAQGDFQEGGDHPEASRFVVCCGQSNILPDRLHQFMLEVKRLLERPQNENLAMQSLLELGSFRPQ